MRKKIPKPFSELSRTEKIADARAAIERLRHPHNFGSRECWAAVQHWQDTLSELTGSRY